MSKTQPFFSIITCTYNSEKYIEENLKSVENQSFTDYEHLIIDGNSQDKTVTLVNKYQSKNPQIKLHSYPPKGISNALNRGIKQCSGKYLIHLNSDDYFASKSVLNAVYDALHEHDYPDVLYGKIRTIEDDGTAIGTFPNQDFLQKANPTLLKYINFVPHQAVFVKKQVFDQFGLFDETLSSSMDYDLWLRIMNKTDWRFIDTIISNYRVRRGAQSSDKRNKEQNSQNLHKILQRHLNTLERQLVFLFNYLLSLRSSLLR